MELLTSVQLSAYLDFALNAIWEAGRITLGYFQTSLQVERKADDSPVTIADRRAEEYLRERIGQKYPLDDIIGEEFPSQQGRDTLVWVIDPIDGTKSFIHGVPLYGQLLALVDGGTPLLGIAHFPALNETVYAAQGMGCFWNGRRARVSDTERLDEATMLFSDVAGWGEAQPVFDQLVAGTRLQRNWGDCYGYALVATGRADLMIDAAMNVWDSAPFQVIFEEAGGSFTNWQGEPNIYSRQTVGVNAALRDEVIAITGGNNG